MHFRPERVDKKSEFRYTERRIKADLTEICRFYTIYVKKFMREIFDYYNIFFVQGKLLLIYKNTTNRDL